MVERNGTMPSREKSPNQGRSWNELQLDWEKISHPTSTSTHTAAPSHSAYQSLVSEAKLWMPPPAWRENSAHVLSDQEAELVTPRPATREVWKTGAYWFLLALVCGITASHETGIMVVSEQTERWDYPGSFLISISHATLVKPNPA